MYVNLRDLPLIVSHDGIVEEPVANWSKWLLKYRNLSRSTVNGYVNSLNQFYEFLKHFCNYEFNSTQEIEKYILQYRDGLLHGNPN